MTRAAELRRKYADAGSAFEVLVRVLHDPDCPADLLIANLHVPWVWRNVQLPFLLVANPARMVNALTAMSYFDRHPSRLLLDTARRVWPGHEQKAQAVRAWGRSDFLGGAATRIHVWRYRTSSAMRGLSPVAVCIFLGSARDDSFWALKTEGAPFPEDPFAPEWLDRRIEDLLPEEG